ncbi:MAG: hypothetical protein KBT30_02845 [Clostridiales bacterium]|nr:hypothetical protein [Candidatus Apopatousia equi]
MEKILISNDLFNISNRLKSIDEKYFILYDKKLKRFEVHYKRNKSTLELVVPYKVLDKRTIDLVLSSKVENKKKLFEEMERHNQRLRNEQDERLCDKTNFMAKEMMRFCEKNGDDYLLNFDDSFSTKWI